jgi:hypothetical protein
MKDTKKKWYQSNRESEILKAKEWASAHPEYVRRYRDPGYNKKYNLKRRREDRLYRLSGNIRSRIAHSFKAKGWKKNSKAHKLLGCDFSTLESHLIASAIKNYGYWTDIQQYHIDHIIPLSSAKSLAELIKLNHYSNLQFLTPKDNLKKSAKLIT